MLHQYISIFILFYTSLSFGQQQTISGQLIDKQIGLPIASASVTIKSANNKVLAFKATDKQGYFTIVTSANLEHAYLDINHLGYKRYNEPLQGKRKELKIELQQTSIHLADVEVKSRPQIRQIGDTLSYQVNTFAQDEDRSIGDVLKRLPGIEVSESGAIKYQGKSISQFYIDGDDLLEDRYNIGTRTIPHKMVKDIQVLNNHEHLKVLKNKRFTDDVAINLVIKEDAKLKMTGEAQLAAGLPKLYDAELNSMLFNKRYKLLNVISANNAGKDLSKDIVGHSQNDVLRSLGASPINTLLNIGTVGPPPVKKSDYFMNRSFGINLNNLVNTRNEWQLKSNIQAVSSKDNRTYKGVTNFTTTDETFAFDEQQYTETRKNLLAFRLSMNKNTPDKYISNNLSLEFADEDALADIYSREQNFAIKRNHQIKGLSNELKYAPSLKNGDVQQVDWSFKYGSKPQSLQISPGIFPHILNQDQPYQTSVQELEVPTLLTQITSGYHFTKGKIKQYYTVGLNLNSQKLNSEMFLNQDGSLVLPLIDSTENNLDWLRTQYGLTANYSWKHKQLESSLILPLTYQYTHYKDPSYALDESHNKWLLSPMLRLKYRTSKEDDLAFSYNYGSSNGNIQDIYRGLVITNYRSLSANSAELNEQATHSISVNYRLARTLRLLFLNFGLNYSNMHRNAMLSQEINNDITQSILLPLKNTVNTLSAHAGIDKYIFSLASTVKLNVNWSTTDFNQLFNQKLLPFVNTNWGMHSGLEAKLFSKVNLSYQGTLNWSESKQKSNNNMNYSMFSATQNLGFPTSLFKRIHFNISARHLYVKQPQQKNISYIFLDSHLRYRIPKQDIELIFLMDNIANIKTYKTYAVSANQQSQNEYNLRGRTTMLKVIFPLK